MSSTDCDYLIVGGGIAASAATEGILEVDPGARITILSREDEAPYSRPALSKKLWRDPDFTIEGTRLPGPDLDGVTFVPGARAVALDRAGRTVTCEGGERYRYRTLILATSGNPATAGIEPRERIRHYRDLDDYRAIRRIADAGGHVIVAGDGFIGVEIAAVLASSPARVTWVFGHDEPGAATFPREITAHLAEAYTSRGVEFVRGRVAGARESGDAVSVTLEDGRVLTADALVTGLGLTLDLDWLADAGLEVDGGVVVDTHYRSVNDESIYAVGDIANAPCPIFGRRRIEHKDHAEASGRVAGLSAAGRAAQVDRIPYFYSFLFDDGYEALGRLSTSENILVDWIEIGRSLVAYYRDNEGILDGVLLWNLPPQEGWDPKVRAEELLRRRTPYTEAELVGAIARP